MDDAQFLSVFETSSEPGLCDLEWLKSKHPPAQIESPRRTVRCVDLFCGCGGLSLGVLEACRSSGLGFEIVFAADIEEEALKVFRSNFGTTSRAAMNTDLSLLFSSRQLGQPSTIAEELTKNFAGHVDILVAGPPCQGHSDLNNRTRRSDYRNALYLNAVRAIEVLRPSTAIIENVPTVTHDRQDVVGQSVRQLTALGYRLQSGVVSGTKIGLAQGRRRHFLVGCLDQDTDLSASRLFPHERRGKTLRDVIGDLEDEFSYKDGIFYTPSEMTTVNRSRVDFLFGNNEFDLPDRLRPHCHKSKRHSYKSIYGRLSWDKPAQTITTGFGSMGQGRYVHPSRRRVITPHEAARIQGFPDFFDFSAVSLRTRLHNMIGNAVPPKFAALATYALLMN